MISTVKPGAASQHDLDLVLKAASHQLSATSPILVLLQDLASALTRGAEVTVVSQDHELTSSEAASFLGISRSHLLAFMNAGALAYTEAGTSRRIALADLLDFNERRQSARARLAGARRSAT